MAIAALRGEGGEPVFLGGISALRVCCLEPDCGYQAEWTQAELLPLIPQGRLATMGQVASRLRCNQCWSRRLTVTPTPSF